MTGRERQGTSREYGPHRRPCVGNRVRRGSEDSAVTMRPIRDKALPLHRRGRTRSRGSRRRWSHEDPSRPLFFACHAGSGINVLL